MNCADGTPLITKIAQLQHMSDDLKKRVKELEDLIAILQTLVNINNGS